MNPLHSLAFPIKPASSGGNFGGNFREMVAHLFYESMA